MKIVVLIISIIISVKTISYGIFEIKENKNKFGGIFVIAFAIISTIIPNIAVYFKGI